MREGASEGVIHPFHFTVPRGKRNGRSREARGKCEGERNTWRRGEKRVGIYRPEIRPPPALGTEEKNVLGSTVPR